MPSKIIKNKKMIQGWALKAEDDFSFAKDTFKESKFYDHVCFLSQQAVEKYIKAVIIITTGTLTKKQKTHNLIYLAQICRVALDLSDFEIDLRKLTNAYIPARYPMNGYTKFSREDAKECLKSAENIINFIKRKIDLSIYF